MAESVATGAVAPWGRIGRRFGFDGRRAGRLLRHHFFLSR
jgi:hypothetical protein